MESLSDPSKIPDHLNATRRASELENDGYRMRIAMGKARTQVEKLIHHMINHGPISQREAMIDYHVASLTRRICDIEERGLYVHREEHTNPVTGNTYTRYWIEPGDPFGALRDDAQVPA